MADATVGILRALLTQFGAGSRKAVTAATALDKNLVSSVLQRLPSTGEQVIDVQPISLRRKRIDKHDVLR